MLEEKSQKLNREIRAILTRIAQGDKDVQDSIFQTFQTLIEKIKIDKQNFQQSLNLCLDLGEQS